MRVSSNLTLLVLIPFLILSGHLLAAGRKLAVVVGVNNYRANSDLPDLKHAASDAHKLSEVLRKNQFTVYEMTHEIARQDGQEDLAPNLPYIRDQIRGVLGFPNLGSSDTVIVSLHGHGVQFDQVEDGSLKTPKFYFCPADSSIANIKTANQLTDRNNLLPLEELYADLAVCKAATKLLIVDACRNDPTQSTIFKSGLASSTLPKLPPPQGGTAAFFSCKANQRAIEDPDLQQGVFTHFLAKGLAGEADQTFDNRPRDGIITFSELSTYVANNTYAHVYDTYQIRQSPELRGDIDLILPITTVQDTPKISLIPPRQKLSENEIAKRKRFAIEYLENLGSEDETAYIRGRIYGPSVLKFNLDPKDWSWNSGSELTYRKELDAILDTRTATLYHQKAAALIELSAVHPGAAENSRFYYGTPTKYQLFSQFEEASKQSLDSLSLFELVPNKIRPCFALMGPLERRRFFGELVRSEEMLDPASKVNFLALAEEFEKASQIAKAEGYAETPFAVIPMAIVGDLDSVERFASNQKSVETRTAVQLIACETLLDEGKTFNAQQLFSQVDKKTGIMFVYNSKPVSRTNFLAGMGTPSGVYQLHAYVAGRLNDHEALLKLLENEHWLEGEEARRVRDLELTLAFIRGLVRDI